MRKLIRRVPSESNPCTIAERTRVLFFFIIRKIEFFIYIYKNKYFLYAHRDLSVYMARIWESIFIYNSKVSLRGLKVYRWAESSAKIFKNIFFILKIEIFFSWRWMKEKNFYDGSRARATLAPTLSGLECYFFFIIRKIEFSYIYI